jgi:hypothetical protein
MIMLWSLEAYPDLITGINPEDRSQIKEFVEKKLSDFAKAEDISFSPEIFMKALRKTSWYVRVRFCPKRSYYRTF